MMPLGQQSCYQWRAVWVSEVSVAYSTKFSKKIEIQEASYDLDHIYYLISEPSTIKHNVILLDKLFEPCL